MDLNIIKTQEGERLTFKPEGRLDTKTAPQFGEEVNGSLEGITELVFDLEKLVYMSSAGLRVILAAHQSMSDKNGSMIIRNASKPIIEIFEMTGFKNFLTFE